MDYYVYLIKNDTDRTYVGITNNLDKRLSQHNGILKGGAKATRYSNTWCFEKILGGFTKNTAPKFEWYWKNYQSSSGAWYSTKSGMDNKLNRMNTLLKDPEWKHIIVIK